MGKILKKLGVFLIAAILVAALPSCAGRSSPAVQPSPVSPVPAERPAPDNSPNPSPPALPQGKARQAGLEETYERAVLSGPPGKLRLSQVAFAYGDLENINNKGDTAHSIKVLERFPYLVCAEPGRLSPADKIVSDALKEKAKIFGYVYLDDRSPVSLPKVKQEIDSIAAQGWYGVFIDQFGYDFGVTRDVQNEVVEYAHGKNLKCFVNAWSIDDAFGREVDPVHNPDGRPSSLGKDDWYLMESFMMNNGGFLADCGEMMLKYRKGQYYKQTLGIKIACLTYKRKTVSWANAGSDIRRSYLLALALGFDGWWFSDRLEDEAFFYGQDPGINLGDRLLKQLEKVENNCFLAETDSFYILFNGSKYPPLRYIVYDKNRKKQTDPPG
ncbi:MAG: hypothetical protein QHH10_13415 [Peptococcaceae bacterium]|nr:hypothetical protein [Peptococcaceae bacterium]MDH7526293.1 hypothetical protein [Peptococcaceae bacterium]